MRSLLESPRNSEADHSPADHGEWDSGDVIRELDSILSSPYFRSAGRCKQFLRYVVLNKLEGHTDRLKERVIGSELFKRPAGYATGEDPVVRVQAGEVRRRLERYYQSTPNASPLRIELPVGSYCPVFHTGPAAKLAEPETHPGILAAHPASRSKSYVRAAWLLVFTAVVVFAGVAALNSLRRADVPKSILEQFWGPAAASHQPILICIANVRRGSSDTGPQSFSADRAEGNETLTTPGTGQNDDPEIVPAGDASVAIALSGLFGKLDRPSQLRIGAAATYEDLRDFPAVVIGGFNNKWTMQLASNLHFAFVWDRGEYMIREQAPGGKVWTTRLGAAGETVKDFAVVSRLIDSKTGQFTVTVAGIGPRGTQAAGEFVSSARYLEEGLANAPAHWQNRNLQILLETTVTDAVAGPPHVIARYTW
ncbi:MAG TPA: hypothetical protein VFJ10_01750 [Acidobacteriaceae bacterium]|jgi:hypothetical protein|nr:hypothetical protein [Acidobacteriaceae bacterium]